MAGYEAVSGGGTEEKALLSKELCFSGSYAYKVTLTSGHRAEDDKTSKKTVVTVTLQRANST